MTSTNGRLEIFKTDARGHIRVPAERREALLDDFEKSGLSGSKFARLAGPHPQASCARRTHPFLRRLLVQT
jgi:hypothetical protein